MATFALHRSAQVFPDPLRFHPERFDPIEVASRHRMGWLPFGAGAHVCVGAQLAAAELTVALAHLLTDFTVVPVAEATVPPIASGLVLRPAAPMPHSLRRR